MTSDAQIESRRRIADQAALWLLSLQSEVLSEAQRVEFVDWLRASPLHISELLWACQVQRDLAAWKGWQHIAPLDDTRPDKVVRLLESLQVGRPRRSWHDRLRGGLLLASGAAAACLLAILLFTWVGPTVFTTQLGERREMALADGSVVDLAPGSELVVRYHSHERLVALNHGEALFHVAKDPSRPFIVQAALTRVRAVGTVFNVERGDRGVSVTVVEGRVAVSQQPVTHAPNSATESSAAALSLGADEQVSISPAGRATPVRKVQSEAEVGWASGQLVFENETVAEIARRFNLYNRTQVEVLDTDLAAQRISGMFRASDPASFVAFVQLVTGARVARRDPEHITLGATQQSSGSSSQKQ
jgi:transmembrane sensor